VARKIIASIIIVAGIMVFAWLAGRRPKPEKSGSEPPPTQRLGKMIATTIHQSVTDPYFAPFEKLATWMERHPDRNRITVDMMSKWAPDDEIPTCFVWETDGSKLQLDHPADPDVVDILMQRLREGLATPNPTQLLYLSSFKVNNVKYWLGFVGIPAGSAAPTQLAGAFFSMEEYLNKAVPRLIEECASRPRFPLTEFQADSPPIRGDPDGDIAIRILDKSGEVFYQRGRSFKSEQMIYAESQFYPKPIVALQPGWDLQIFSSKTVAEEPGDSSSLTRWGLAGTISLIAVLAIFLIT